MQDGAGAGTQALADESLALARSLGEPWTLGYVLTVLDIRSLLARRRRVRGPSSSEEALACFEEAGDQWGIVLALRHLGMGAIARGDYCSGAAGRREGAGGEPGTLGDRLGQAYTLNALGDIARIQGDYEQAACLL